MLQSLIHNHTALIITSVLLSCVPFVIWILVFRSMKKEQVSLILKTALGGVTCALPILALQYFMQKEGSFDFGIISGQVKVVDIFAMINQGFNNNLYLKTLLTFVIVGVLEEYAKHRVVVTVDSKRDQFKSVIDSIQFSVIAALGFTLIENAIYFYHILQIEGASGFFVPFLFRSILSVFAHIFFSAIYGYHYGLAKFAREKVIEEMGHESHFTILRWLSKITRIDLVTLFQGKEIFLGLAMAMGLHAVYNTLLAFELIFVAIPFIGIGYLYVMYEFGLKHNLINYKKIEDEIEIDRMLHKVKKEQVYVE